MQRACLQVWQVLKEQTGEGKAEQTAAEPMMQVGNLVHFVKSVVGYGLVFFYPTGNIIFGLFGRGQTQILEQMKNVYTGI